MTRTWTNTVTGEEISITWTDTTVSRLQARALIAQEFLDHVGLGLTEWVELPLEAFK
jgi:hypothetical protein